jgi:quercetin 2,3-dioxygenase
MATRALKEIIASIATSDGAGVKLRRSIGQRQHLRLDPFLMLDEFFSDDPADYLAGFPAHPHRGFETVTYMLDGHMLHEDHLGNRGDLVAGAVQWMSAGSGIIHSEMPQQTGGRMRGFQLWVNLPAREKMKPAAYRDIRPEEIPLLHPAPGVALKLIAGSIDLDGALQSGPVNGLSSDPRYLDLHMAADAVFAHAIDPAYNAFVYPYEGEVLIGDRGNALALGTGKAGVLGAGERIEIRAGAQGARLLLLSGRPLNEPVVQYGPFVMNTREEVEQAVRDYQDGRLTLPPSEAPDP